MKALFVAAFIVGGCASVESTSQPVCPEVYDPHLCAASVGDKFLAGYGSNKCQAIQEVKRRGRAEGVEIPNRDIGCGAVYPGE